MRRRRAGREAGRRRWAASGWRSLVNREEAAAKTGGRVVEAGLWWRWEGGQAEDVGRRTDKTGYKGVGWTGKGVRYQAGSRGGR